MTSIYYHKRCRCGGRFVVKYVLPHGFIVKCEECRGTMIVTHDLAEGYVLRCENCGKETIMG